ncbi:MAG TPA: hypothetical protein VKO38_03345 [Wenzhouxiangella sp.]|nr:hypothetical protein [Wenzhouxiangella sp.]
MDGDLAGGLRVDQHYRNLPGRLDTQNLAVKGLDSQWSQTLGYPNRSTC